MLTDEEKALLAQQQNQQRQLQWLTRRDELAQQQQQAVSGQQQARQALADAAPALAKLELAQPAAQLRPCGSAIRSTRQGWSKPASESMK